MTDATVIAITAAIPPTLVALAAFISSVRNGKKVEVATKKVDAAVHEAQKVAVVTDGKVDEIHAVVNSNLTALKLELSDARAQIATLIRLANGTHPK